MAHFQGDTSTYLYKTEDLFIVLIEETKLELQVFILIVFCVVKKKCGIRSDSGELEFWCPQKYRFAIYSLTNVNLSKCCTKYPSLNNVEPLKTTFPTILFNSTYSILLSAPTRAALCLTKRVIGGRVTGVGWGLWWRTLPGGRGGCCREGGWWKRAELWLVTGQTE